MSYLPDTCRVEGCGVRISKGHTMCRAHFDMVPQKLRAAVTNNRGMYSKDYQQACLNEVNRLVRALPRPEPEPFSVEINSGYVGAEVTENPY